MGTLHGAWVFANMMTSEVSWLLIMHITISSFNCRGFYCHCLLLFQKRKTLDKRQYKRDFPCEDFLAKIITLQSFHENLLL